MRKPALDWRLTSNREAYCFTGNACFSVYHREKARTSSHGCEGRDVWATIHGPMTMDEALVKGEERLLKAVRSEIKRLKEMEQLLVDAIAKAEVSE